jgi:peptidyl-prolyl cis-trans isomerase D
MLLAARVIEHQPAASRPFEEVRAEILSRLIHDKAAELAKQEGETLLARLRKGEADGRTWSGPQMVSRERRTGLPQDAAEAVFSADVGKLPVYFGLSTPDGRYVIYRVSRVVDVQTVDAEARKMLARQFEQVLGMEAETARLRGIKERSKVEINAKAIEKSS